MTKQSGAPILFNATAGDDDAQLTQALTVAQESAAVDNPRWIHFPHRPLHFTQPRKPFSGLRILGASGPGPKNVELGLAPNLVTVDTPGPWWDGSGQTLYDVHVGELACSLGAQSSFWQHSSGTLYACEFNSLSFLGGCGVFGTRAAKALLTQVLFTGHWTIEGSQDVPIHVGGSDCALWVAGYLNVEGPSSPNGQGRPLVWCDWLGKSAVDNLYVTAHDGWRGIRVDGSTSYPTLTLTGCRTEGHGAGTPCDGTLLQVNGGNVSIRDHWAAYGMNAPASSEGGIVQVNGGQVTIDTLSYDPGSSSAPLLYVNGGTVRLASAIGCKGTPTVKVAAGTLVDDGSVSRS